MNRRIIIVSTADSFFTEPFVRAFNKLGFECMFFDYRQGAVYANEFFRKLIKRFKALRPLKLKQVARTNKKLLELATSYNPEFVIVLKGENIGPATLNAIRSKNIKIANFYNDFINQWNVIEKIAPHYDRFFSPDHYVLKKLAEKGLSNCSYLPFAIENIGGFPFEDRNEVYPVTFLGSYNNKIYPNREPVLSKIKDLGLNIWGNPQWADSSLSEYYRGVAVGTDRFDIYRKSKIVVDINFDVLPCEAISMRPFEAGLSGALLVSDNVRADLFRVF
ncbi:MAG: hypothetical protein WD889_01800, partial [Candidatus Colwellbacteria bacterium]